MKRVSRATFALMVVACTGLFGASFLHAQGAAEQPMLAGKAFKNVTVMKDIPVDQFMQTMGFFSASLGMSCEDCHKAKDTDWSGFAVDNPVKNTARRMIQMMQKINEDNFAGRQLVTCYSCHRSADAPRSVPNFEELYGAVPSDPNAVIVQSPLAPKPEEVLDKYLAAVGGAQKAATLTSLVARGNNVGYGPEGAQDKRAVQLYAKPTQRVITIQTTNGLSTTTFDGKAGWMAAPLRPFDVMPVVGQELEGLRIDAALMFPSQVKQIATRWRVGNPVSLDGKDQWVVQGNTTGGVILSLYFDQQTGLLTRAVRYAASIVGRIPVQTDYSDYRDVNGVKVPHKFTFTWLDGRDTFELTQVQANANIEAARFNKPAPSAAPAPRAGAR